MNLDINYFKNELSNYYFLKSKLQRIDDQKLELEVKRGISAVRYDKEATQGSGDPLKLELNRLEDIERAEQLEEEYKRYKARLDLITDFLKQSEIGDAIMKIHCTGKSTYDKEAANLYVGVRTLKRMVNREIDMYLKQIKI